MAISGAEEIYRKLSSQISSQFPEFLKTDGSKFIAFLKAYFEYMEIEGNAGDAGRGLIDTFDIDRTVDDFVEYFHREFMVSIPRSVLADKKLLAKHIRQFYRSRGSQDSYRFLFRALYNEEVDFYYPGDDILRASDGRWVQETVIRGIPSGNPNDLDGKEITGGTSGAKARVQEILPITASGISLTQLRIENVIGEFVEDEVVSDAFGNSIRIFNAAGSISSVIVVDGGAFHVTGDSVTLSGDNGGGASGSITSTTDISGATFRIQNGGSGYRVGNTDITLTGGDPVIPAQIQIVNISNTELISINQNIIEPAQNVPLNTVPFGVGTGNFPTSNVNSILSAALTFGNVVVGSINTIALLTPGSGYTGSLPDIDALDEEIRNQSILDLERGGYKGHNAVIIASRAPGAITAISIDASDINFLKNDDIMITNTTRSSANTTDTNTDLFGGITRGLIRKGLFPATVTAEIAGTFELPGRYIDTKGFLSWNNRLQDNDFYQEFSYALIVRKLLDDYRGFLKTLVHPSGTKMFGIVRNETGVDLNQYVNSGSATVLWKRLHSNNVVRVSGKTVRITVPPFWAAGLPASANVLIVPVSNVSATNGHYTVNAVLNSSVFTLKNVYAHGLLTNGYFYYGTSHTGVI